MKNPSCAFLFFLPKKPLLRLSNRRVLKSVTPLRSKTHSSPHLDCFKSMVDAHLPQSSCAYEEMELRFAGKALASSGVSLDLCFSSNKWLMTSVRVNNLHKFNIFFWTFSKVTSLLRFT